MGKNVVQVLAENLSRLCDGPKGMSILEVGRRAQIGKSTIDRIKKGETAVRINNLEDVAQVFGLEAWQLLYPNLSRIHPPTEVDIKQDFSEEEYLLIKLYGDLGQPEKEYILSKAKQLADEKDNGAANNKSAGRTAA